VSETLFYRLCS